MEKAGENILYPGAQMKVGFDYLGVARETQMESLIVQMKILNGANGARVQQMVIQLGKLFHVEKHIKKDF